jgi:hypothetical protein
MQTSNRNQYSNDLSNSILEFMNIHYGFVMNCMISSDSEINIPSNRKLLKKVNILGKETNQNDPQLFYIYDDGTVEKRITIE